VYHKNKASIASYRYNLYLWQIYLFHLALNLLLQLLDFQARSKISSCRLNLLNYIEWLTGNQYKLLLICFPSLSAHTSQTTNLPILLV